MKIHPYIFAGIGSRIRFWKTYEIQDGYARIESSFTKSPHALSLKDSSIKMKRSLKVLGFGSITIKATNGDTQEWTKVPNVHSVYENLLRAARGEPLESSETDTSTVPRKVLTEDDGTLRGSRLLTDVKQLTAITLLDNGSRIITSERYGDRGACLAIYDVESLQLLREFVFADGLGQPNAIGVVSDPERIIIDVDGGLSIIDLRAVSVVGQPMPMYFYHTGNSGKPEWWQYPFLGKKEFFKTGTIGIFDGGRTTTVHCGIAAPRMPSNLVSWNLASYQLKVEHPVFTPDISPSPMMTDDMAGVPDVKRRQFITGQRFGWVNFWDIDTLNLVRAWRIESPESCKRPQQSRANNEIQTMSLSNDSRILAIGTWCGAIHVCDTESGKEVVTPLIPNDFDYTQKDEYSYSPKYASEVMSLHFFADDQYLIAGYADSSLRIWDVKSGFQVGEPLAQDERKGNPQVDLLCVIPKFRKAISACSSSYNSDIRVWDVSQYYGSI